MDHLKCAYADCGQRATMHFVRANAGQECEVECFCDQHGRLHIRENHDHYYASSRVGPGSPPTVSGGTCFAIDFLFCDELQDKPWGRNYVQLIETEGHRRVGFVIDTLASQALYRELERTAVARPLPHRAMAQLIGKLGARLSYVVIDEYHRDECLLEAKLQLDQGTAKAALDVRPSDAIVLAVICGVPIIVSDAVLGALNDQPPDAGSWVYYGSWKEES